MSYVKRKSTGGGGSSDSFTTIQTDSGTSPVADSPTDILTITGTGGITIIGDASTDTITIQGSGSGTPGGADESIQFNDAGSFNGFGSWDGSTLTIPGILEANTYAGPGSGGQGMVISAFGHATFQSNVYLGGGFFGTGWQINYDGSGNLRGMNFNGGDVVFTGNIFPNGRTVMAGATDDGVTPLQVKAPSTIVTTAGTPTGFTAVENLGISSAYNSGDTISYELFGTNTSPDNITVWSPASVMVGTQTVMNTGAGFDLNWTGSGEFFFLITTLNGVQQYRGVGNTNTFTDEGYGYAIGTPPTPTPTTSSFTPKSIIAHGDIQTDTFFIGDGSQLTNLPISPVSIGEAIVGGSATGAMLYVDSSGNLANDIFTILNGDGSASFASGAVVIDSIGDITSSQSIGTQGGVILYPSNSGTSSPDIIDNLANWRINGDGSYSFANGLSTLDTVGTMTFTAGPVINSNNSGSPALDISDSSYWGIYGHGGGYLASSAINWNQFGDFNANSFIGNGSGITNIDVSTASGILPIANGGTNSANPFILTGDMLYFDGTSITTAPLITAGVGGLYVNNAINSNAFGDFAGSVTLGINNPGSVSNLMPDGSGYSSNNFFSWDTLGNVTANSLTLSVPYNPFNQSLNTGDSPTFSDLTVSTLNINGQGSIDSFGNGHLNAYDFVSGASMQDDIAGGVIVDVNTGTSTFAIEYAGGGIVVTPGAAGSSANVIGAIDNSWSIDGVGAGKLAANAINWDSSGNLTVSSVSAPNGVTIGSASILDGGSGRAYFPGGLDANADITTVGNMDAQDITALGTFIGNGNGLTNLNLSLGQNIALSSPQALLYTDGTSTLQSDTATTDGSGHLSLSSITTPSGNLQISSSSLVIDFQTTDLEGVNSLSNGGTPGTGTFFIDAGGAANFVSVLTTNGPNTVTVGNALGTAAYIDAMGNIVSIMGTFTGDGAGLTNIGAAGSSDNIQFKEAGVLTADPHFNWGPGVGLNIGSAAQFTVATATGNVTVPDIIVNGSIKGGGVGPAAMGSDLDINGWSALRISHLTTDNVNPGIAAGTGAGTAPTVSITGGDTAGAVTVTTGTLPTGTNAVVATITFNSSYGSAPYVVIYPANAITATLSGVSMVFVTSTTTTFVITSGTTALTAASTYKWNYHTVA